MTNLMRFTLSAAIVLSASLLTGTMANAGGPQVQAPATCQPQTVTKIVMVPQVTYKTTTVPVCVLQPRVKQQNIMVRRLVPETKTVSRMVTVMVPHKQVRQISVPVCRMTYEDEQYAPPPPCIC